MQGKQIPLGIHDPNDQAGAWDAFRTLVAKAMTDTPPRLPGPIAGHVGAFLGTLEHTTADRTRKAYGVHLNEFCRQFGGLAFDALDPKAIESHFSRRKWSDSHRANVLWTIQSFVRWGGRSDFTLRRPAKESRGAASLISEETHRLVLRETTGDFHELCRFLWAVGCRPMEGARITADMVDWSTGTVTLRQHKTAHKGKNRVLYLNTEAVGILQGQLARHGSGPLFRQADGRAFTLRAIVGRFCRVAKKVGKPVSAYCYRHTFATRALNAGIPDTHVAAILGHSSTAMIHKHYSHVSESGRLLREMVEKMAGKNSGNSGNGG